MSTRPIWSSSTSGLGSSDHQTTTTSNSSTMSTPKNNINNSTSIPINSNQEWCLHAQLTIRHPSATGKMIVKPTSATLKADDMLLSPSTSSTTTMSGDRPTRNLHFECSWENSGESIVTEVIPMESGIQKFESWLQAQPVKGSSTPVSNNGLGSPYSFPSTTATTPTIVRFPLGGDPDPVPVDQGGGKNSQFGNLFKQKVIQPYGRRCKSTCSITLTSNATNNGATVSFVENRCGSVESERASSLPPTKPVLKDAETQTVNNSSSTSNSRINQPKIVQKLFPTSIIPQSSNPEFLNGVLKAVGSVGVGGGSRTGNGKKDKIINGSSDEESLNFPKQLKTRPTVAERLGRRVSRSTSQCRAKSSPPVHQQKANQPRTIHIDVYCTGSDVSTNTEDNSSSSGEESTTTSQTTVYESPQYKISHHSKKKQMPICFSSNVADLVNLAKNQIKLHPSQQQQQYYPHRQDKDKGGGRKGVVEKLNCGPQPPTRSPLPTTTVTPKILKNALSQGKSGQPPPPLVGQDFFDNKTIFLGHASYDDSLSTSYPSSVGISRNTTATSFSSDWTQVDLNERRVVGGDDLRDEMDNLLHLEDELSQEFLFSSKSRSLDSVSRGKSYEYSVDSLEESPAKVLHPKDDNSKHSFPNPQHNKDSINVLHSPDHSKVGGGGGGGGRREPTNLLRMKRLSIPNYDLDGISVEDLLPPFMPTTVPNDPVDPGETLLLTATKFGSVVKGFKKPGHHITGPAKNPNCPCSHCRFHFEEKEDNNNSGGGGK